MAATNPGLEDLLTRFAKGGTGKTANNFTPALVQQKSNLRDTGINYARQHPTLLDALDNIAKGNGGGGQGALASIFSNPVVKTAFLPLQALDTGRRAIISGVREVTDLMDTDPNTRASFSDWSKQTKDFSYGFGKAFPMEGWGGRAIGLAGDLVLDPINWATLGAAVAPKALFGATGQLSRVALGGVARTGVKAKIFGANKPVRFVTRESREELARVVGNQMRGANLMDDAERAALGLVKRSEQEIWQAEKTIARYGKNKVPPDMANFIGLSKAGIYFAGSRIRVPGTGYLGKGLESMLSGSRVKLTGITTGAIGKFMMSITPTGSPSSTLNVRHIRRALQAGTVTDEEAHNYLKILSADSQQRVDYSQAAQEYGRDLNIELGKHPDIVTYRASIGELVENPTPERIAAAHPSEVAAANKVRNWWSTVREKIVARGQTVDKEFKMGDQGPSYLPHIETDRALRLLDNVNHPTINVPELRAMLKTDASDASNNLKARTLVEDKMWFGKPLTKEDVAGGAVRLNALARERGKIDFDFFETDVITIMQKYGRSFAEESSSMPFHRAMMEPGGPYDFLRKTGQYDTEALDETGKAFGTAVKGFNSALRDVATAARAVSDEVSASLKPAKVKATKSAKNAKAALTKVNKGVKEATIDLTRTQKVIANLVEVLEKSGMRTAQSQLDEFGVSGLGADIIINHQMKLVLAHADSLQLRLTPILESLRAPMDDAIDGVAFKAKLLALNDEIAKFENDVAKMQTRILEMESIHNVLGEFVNGKWSSNAIHNALEAGDEVEAAVLKKLEDAGHDTVIGNKILGKVKNPGIRDKLTVNKKGTLRPTHVRSWWGEPTAGQVTLRTLLDPLGKVPASRLKKMTIHDVRKILFTSNPTATSLKDVHAALVWMVIREVEYTPGLMDAFLTQGKNALNETSGVKGLLDNSGSVVRFNKTREAIEGITRLQDALDDIARVSGKIPEPGKKGKVTYGSDALRLLREQEASKVDELNSAHLALRDVEVKGSGDILLQWDEITDSIPDGPVTDRGHMDLVVNALDGLFDHEKLVPFYNQLMAGNLTYEDVTRALESLGQLKSETTLTGKQLAEYNVNLKRAENVVLARKNELEVLQEKISRAAPLDKKSQAYSDRIINPATYVEQTTAYTNQALEYYLYSESKIQFNDILNDLTPWGIEPSYGVYQRILSDVANSHVDKTKEYAQQFNTAVEIMEGIRTQVQGQPVPMQGAALRELIQTALDGPDGELLNAMLPELRPVVMRDKIQDFTRIEMLDPVLIEIREEFSLILRTAKGHNQARAKMGGGVVDGSGRKAQRTVNGQEAGAYGSVRPGIQQKSIDTIIAELEGSRANISTVKLLEAAVAAMGKMNVPENALLRRTVGEKLLPIARKRVAELKAIEKANKAARRLAGDKSGTRAASKSVQSKKRLAKDNYNYGLTGSLELAVVSGKSRDIKRFWGNFLGGEVPNDASGVVAKFDVKTNRAARNQAKAWKTIDSADSYTGGVKSGISDRTSALLETSAGDYPMKSLLEDGSVVPSLTGGDAQSAFGVKAYQDLLLERANELKQAIDDNKAWSRELARLRKEVNKTDVSSLEKTMKILAKLEAVEKAVPTVGTLFRISDQTDISSLPKAWQKKVYKIRQLKIRQAELEASPDYIPSKHEQLLNGVLNELSSIDGWRVVGVDGRPGIYLEQGGLRPRRTFNAPLPHSDAPSNVDSKAINAWIKRNGFVPDEEVQHAAIAAGHADVYTMKAVTGTPDVVGMYFQMVGGRLQRITDFETLATNPTDIKLYEYVPRDGHTRKYGKDMRAENMKQDARVGSGKDYDPAYAFVEVNATDGRTLYVPITEIIGDAVSTPLTREVFSEAEWKSLFSPAGADEPNALRSIEFRHGKSTSELTRHQQLRPQAQTRAAQNAWQKRLAMLEAKVKETATEREALKARAAGRAKLNKLVEAFNSPEVARALGMKVEPGKQVNPVEVARAYVKKQTQGLDVQSRTVSAGVASGERKAALAKTWADSRSAAFMDELGQVATETNALAFDSYAGSLAKQYKAYTDLLGELQKMADEWKPSMVTPDTAKTITGILDNPKVVGHVPPARPDMESLAPPDVQAMLQSGDEAGVIAALAAHNKNLQQTRGVATRAASKLGEADVVPAFQKAPDAEALAGKLNTELTTAQREMAALKALKDDLDSDEAIRMVGVDGLNKILTNLSQEERLVLSNKAKALTAIGKEDAARKAVIRKALNKNKVKGARHSPVERLQDLQETLNLQQASFDQAALLKKNSYGDENTILQAQRNLQMIEDFKALKAPTAKEMAGRNLDWIPGADAWKEEAEAVLTVLSNKKDLPVKTKKILAAYVEARNALELSIATKSTAEYNLNMQRFIKDVFGASGNGGQIFMKELQKGYVFLNEERFPNIVVKQAYAEIFQNANRIKDPFTSTGLGRLLRQWNSYWKPLATATPGFHVRNNINNVFTTLLGGAIPENSIKGSKIGWDWFAARKKNIAWADFVKDLPADEQGFAEGAYWALHNSGTGAFDDYIHTDNIVQNFAVIKGSHKLGTGADQLARFSFSYDAMAQGFTKEQAAMRTKKFFIDYEDVSTFDMVARQILPFWMWSSRNVVTQVQNMWMNPRPYAQYNSFKRNFSDDKDDDVVSRSWKELGAFKLPFGKNLYAMPDLGFTKVQQQLAMTQNPGRFLADLNPLIRLPMELAGGKQFYNDRKFNENPTPVSGVGAASVLQPLAQLLGMGNTNAQGQRFIDPKLLYAITGAAPPLNVSERLMPSAGADTGGLSLNALAGFLGSFVKQQSEGMQGSELMRRKFEMQALASRNKAMSNP